MDVEGIPYPWERQPGENARAFSAFCYYRDINPLQRTARLAHENYARDAGTTRPNLRVWEDWSSRNRWVERAAAWDDEQDRIRREEAKENLRKMAERQARQAEQLSVALMQPALALLRKLQQEQQRISNLLAADPTASEREEGTPELLRESMASLSRLAADCAKSLPQVIQVERLSRGLSTEHQTVELRRAVRKMDPVQTQEDYAWDVVEAMIEANMIPDPFVDGEPTP